MEKVARFGSSASLVGVLTEPESKSELPGVIILNSGIMHRIGTCRISVRIARTLAKAGFYALRFDASGIGDSGPRKDSLPFEESAPMEVKEAMDYLTKTKGVKKFILMGLCSGADAGYETALREEDVVGVIQIDAYAYRTWKANLIHIAEHYGPRVSNVDVWKRWVARKLASLRGEDAGNDKPGDDLELPSYVRVFPPQSQITAGLRKLTRRGVRMFCLFTGDEQAYKYERQFFDMHPGVTPSQVTVKRLDEADHILTALDLQVEVVESIASWATARTWGA